MVRYLFDSSYIARPEGTRGRYFANFNRNTCHEGRIRPCSSIRNLQCADLAKIESCRSLPSGWKLSSSPPSGLDAA